MRRLVALTGAVVAIGACHEANTPLGCVEDLECEALVGVPAPCHAVACLDGVCGERVAADGAACDDGSACTGPDMCSAGTCLGAAVVCDDGVDCTADACDPLTGCAALPDDSMCDDQDACTRDACDAVAGCKNIPSSCGNGLCDCGEDKLSCAADCPDTPPQVDLNGAAAGLGFQTTFVSGGGPVVVVARDGLTVTDADDTELALVVARLSGVPDGALEALSVVAAAGVTPSYDPSTGVLTLTGPASAEAFQDTLRTLTYDNTALPPDTADRVVSITATDPAGGVSATAIATITVQHVNRVPLIDLNGPGEAGVNTTRAFIEGDDPVALVAGDASVADADGSSLSGLTAVISPAPDGDLEGLIADTAGTALVAVYDSASATLTVSGQASLADYAVVLASLRYTNASEDPGGATRAVTVTVDDGSDTASATASITVDAVNDAPIVLPAAPPAVTWVEDQGPVALIPDASVVDVDGIGLSSAIIAVSSADTTPSEVLAATTAGTPITATFADGVLTLSGQALHSVYAQVLASVMYDSPSQAPTAAERTVTVVVNDGTADGPATAVALSIVAVNDPPMLDLNGAASGADSGAAWVEGGGPVAIVDAALSIVDIDDTTLASASAVVGNAADAPAEALAVDTTGTVLSAAFSSADSRLTITGPGPLADFEQVLRTLTFDAATRNPTTTDRLVTISVSDGTASEARTATIGVTAVSDAPVVVLGVPATAAFTEGDGPTSVVPAGTLVDDPDSDALALVTLTLSPVPDGAREVLAADATGTPVTATWASPVLTLAGPATAAELTQVLATVTYDNTAENPADAQRTVAIQARDETQAGPIANVSVDVAFVNSAPVLDLNGAAPGSGVLLTFDEGDPALAFAAAATLTDADSVNMARATVTLTNAMDGPDERLDVPNIAGVTGMWDSASGVLSLTGAAPPSSYQAALRAVIYANPSANPDPTNRVITVVVSDGVADSAVTIATLTIVPFNSPPLIGADSYAVGAHTTLVVSDPAQGVLANDSAVESAQTLTLSDVSGTAGADLSVAADGTFTYTPPVGFVGVDTFSYTVTDDAPGDPKSAVGTVAITVAGPVVWFVDNLNGGIDGDGRATAPFLALAQAAAPTSGVGDTIRVLRDADLPVAQQTVNQANGFQLAPGQTLEGGGAVPPVIGTTATSAIVMADGCTVRDLIIDGGAVGGGVVGGGTNGTISGVTVRGAVDGVTLSGSSGSWAFTELVVTGASGVAFAADQAGAVSITGGVLDGARGLDVSASSLVATLTRVSATSAPGIRITNAVGSDVAIDTLELTASTGTALVLDDAGAFTVTSAGGASQIVTSDAAALDVSGTAVQAMDLALSVTDAPTDAVRFVDSPGMKAFSAFTVTTVGGAGLVAHRAGTLDLPAATVVDARGGAALDLESVALARGGVPGLVAATLGSTDSPGQGVRLASLADAVTVTGSVAVTGAALNAVDVRDCADVSLARLDVSDSGTANNAVGQAALYVSGATSNVAVGGGGIVYDAAFVNDNHGVYAVGAGGLSLSGDCAGNSPFLIRGVGSGPSDLTAAAEGGPHGVLAVGVANVALRCLAVDTLGETDADGAEDGLRLVDTANALAVTQCDLSGIADGDALRIAQRGVAPASVFVGTDAAGSDQGNVFGGGFVGLALELDGAISPDVVIAHNTFQDWGTLSGDGTGIAAAVTTAANASAPVQLTIDQNTLSAFTSAQLGDAVSVVIGDASSSPNVDLFVTDNVAIGGVRDGVALAALGGATVRATVTNNTLVDHQDAEVRLSLLGATNTATLEALVTGTVATGTIATDLLVFSATGGGTLTALAQANQPGTLGGVTTQVPGGGSGASLRVNLFDHAALPSLTVALSDLHQTALGTPSGVAITVPSTTVDPAVIADVMTANGNTAAGGGSFTAGQVAVVGVGALPIAIIDAMGAVFDAGPLDSEGAVMRTWPALALAAMGCALAAPAVAAPPEQALWIGPFGGPLLIPDTWDLAQQQGARRDLEDSGALIGLRVGAQPAPWLALELSAAALFVAPQDTALSNFAAVYHGSVLVMPWASDVQPYLALGAGAYQGLGGDLGEDADWQTHWGLGLRAWSGDWGAFRLDVRHALTDSYDDDTALASVVEVTVGFDIMLWRAQTDPPPPSARQTLVTSTTPPAPDRDGDGVPDSDDRCPDAAGVRGMLGCPDGDGDAMADVDDACPDAAGAWTTSGCPDGDGDGVADREDRCPTQAGDPDFAGCAHAVGATTPVEPPPIVTPPVVAPPKVPLATLRGVSFRYARKGLREAAKTVLDKVADTLTANPTWVVHIAGYTDSLGEVPANKRLSQQRAQMVADYLATRGIAARRMTVVGHGETNFVAPNDQGEANRALNRRVEVLATVPRAPSPAPAPRP